MGPTLAPAQLRTCLALVLLAMAANAQTELLEIRGDLQLDPKKVYGGIVIAASGVTVDGRGAWVINRAGVDQKKFSGVGISARGVSNVKLRDVYVKGFETGLEIRDAESWTIEGCDFSDNFTDPDFGWGESARRGGIVLTNVDRSTIRRTKANRNWDGCSLEGCDDNTLEENDFSHASNTCLKLWNSSRNLVRTNNLSWGIRINPGEVHARDSCCLLIESGSNQNRFVDNDVSHGGDGVFIRVLNGWTSVDNHFEGNDASYANNNGFEAWSPRNTYVRNKANWCSYGFWLGASDKTVLIGNEAGNNGDPTGNHNAPEAFGHGGIVFVNGPSSHTIVQGNWCHDNQGGGIVLRGDEASQGRQWQAYHWIIQRNKLERNRWGIYARWADWIDVVGNEFVDNSEAEFHDAGGVTNLTRGTDDPAVTQTPKAVLTGPRGPVKVGSTVYFDAGLSSDARQRPLSYRWNLGDGTIATQASVRHIYQKPGFHRVGLTVGNGVLYDLAWLDLYVVENLEELGSEASAEWSWVDQTGGCQVVFEHDSRNFICGKSSLFARIEPYDGMRVALQVPKTADAHWSLEGKRELVFWLKWINPNVPAWQDANPIVSLHENAEKFVRLVPDRDFLSTPEHIEGRDGWNYFAVPLAGGEHWKREGGQIVEANWLTLGFDSWGAPPLSIWIDGLALK